VRRIYYGWYVVALSILGFMLLVGSTFTAFGLFVVPVSEELGLSRADMNTALILLNIGNAAVAPFIGRMLDRFPVRWIMSSCALLFGACLITLGLSQSLLLSAFVFALPLAVALQGTGTLTVTVLLARWFQVQRGRAMALAALGMSFGSIVVTPAVGFLIQAEGWRTALMTAGGVVAAIMLVAAFVIRDRPGPEDVEPGKPVQTGAASAAAAAVGRPATLGALMSTGQFWTISLGSALALGASQAVSVSLAPLALGGGLTMVQATTLISAAGGGAIAGKLLLAVVADRVDRILLLTTLFVLMAAISAVLSVSVSYVSLLCSAVVLGVITGAMTPVFYALLADRFGTPSFGTVRGLMAPIVAVVSAVAVRFAGEVYDRTAGYDVMFYTFIVTQLLATALIFSTRFFGRPAMAQPLGPVGAVAE
jgi:sugar phosphate permease